MTGFKQRISDVRSTAPPIEPQPLPQDLVKFPFKVGTRLSDWLDQGRLKQYFKNRFVCFSMVDDVINIFFLFHPLFSKLFLFVRLKKISVCKIFQHPFWFDSNATKILRFFSPEIFSSKPVLPKKLLIAFK